MAAAPTTAARFHGGDDYDMVDEVMESVIRDEYCGGGH